MGKNFLVPALAFCLVLHVVSGCASVNSALMPRQDRVVVSEWKSYEEARQVFEKVSPKQNLEDLKKIGLDPQKLPNVTILDPLTIRNLFLGNNPAVRLLDLPPQIREYLQDLDNCEGFRYRQESIKTKGRGSIILRILTFVQEDVTTGWKFEVSIFLKKDTKQVVFALWNGDMNVNQVVTQIDPLGPLSKIFSSSRVVMIDKLTP